MSIRLKLTKSLKAITFISVYAPTFKAKVSEKESFYYDLQRAIETVPSGDIMIVLGDFNARVGNDWHTWKGVIGNQGFDEVNANGFTLLEFCCRNGLCITNTFFKHQPWHKATWMHPRSKGLHMIDFIITRQ